jgi:hypothetical protein
MTLPVRHTGALLLLTLVLAVSGCSSSGDTGSNGRSGSSASTDAEHCPVPKRPGVGRKVATKKAITKAYKVFFDTDTALADSVAVLQHGAVLCAPLLKQSSNPAANKITAKVSKVVLQGKNVAKVKFTIFSAGQTLLPNTSGFAVRENGHWKVAAKTFCSLLQLQGIVPSACKKPAITALPH